MAGLRYPKIAGYEFIRQIGGGGFSVVFEALNVDEHRVAACKVITLSGESTDKERKTIEKEIRIHSVLKHENVLEFINALVVEPNGKHRYVSGIYMLLELASGGDLFDKIAPDVGVPEDVAHLYFQQLVAGMQYIHEQGVCHRDLKPENLLLSAAGTLKISDFGLSSVYMLKETGRRRKLTERCGSLPYVAPELSTEDPYEAEPIDVWGVGVILFTLLLGNTPWDEPTRRSNEFSRYLDGLVFKDEPWNRLNSESLSLLCGLLTVDPKERMTLADAWSHPWVNRPSQLAGSSHQTLAEHLTQSLRATGDLDYVSAADLTVRPDVDEDQSMPIAPQQSQFTQTLLLFSQTQSGMRYEKSLTRFYATMLPPLFASLIEETLKALNVKVKGPTSDEDGHLRLRVGGYDRRRQQFKGWIRLEEFHRPGIDGAYCVMDRDEGNPISWRQLWKAIIEAESISPLVLRKSHGR